MATTTEIKPSETDYKIDVDLLNKPEQALKSVQQSILFTKQMVAVAVSAICYIRDIYPPEYFRTRHVGRLSVQIIKNIRNDPRTTRLLNWLRGSFQAMQKGYLKDIIFGVQPPGEANMNKALESYIFNIKYSNLSQGEQIANTAFTNSHIMTINGTQITANTLQESIINCFESLVDITKNMPNLPKGCSLNMMLTYHEGTPEEYEPPGFKPCEFDSFVYPEGHIGFKIGKFSTPYHTVRLEAIASCLDEIVETPNSVLAHDSQQVADSQISNEEISNSALQSEMPNINAVQNMMIAPEMSDISNLNRSMNNLKTNTNTGFTDMLFTPREKTAFEKSFEEAAIFQWDKSAQSNPLPTHVETTKINFLSQYKEAPMPNNDSDKTDSVNTYGEVKISCVCENDDEFELMIRCASCTIWNHGACYGFLTTPAEPYAHFCVSCCDDNDKLVCTDSKIAALPRAERINLAYLRRAISYCNGRTQFRLESLVQELRVPDQLVQPIIQQLESLSILKPTTSHQPPMTIKRSVNKKMMCKHLKLYFTAEQESRDTANESLNLPSSSRNRNVLSELQNQEEITEGTTTRTSSGNRKRLLDSNVFLKMCGDSQPGRKRAKVSEPLKKNK